MSSLAERSEKLLAKAPMAMVVVPFAMGVFFAEGLEVPLWLLLLLCTVALIGAIIFKGWRQIGALGAMLFGIGALIHTLSYGETTPYNQPYDMVLKVATSSIKREGYTSAEARIEECENKTLTGRNVVLWGDSLLHLSAGDRVHLAAPIRPFRAEREAYARLMHHRRFVGAISLSHKATYEYIPAPKRTLHDWAVERLRTAMEPSDARGVVLAMTTGERAEIRGELRQCYSASGASHLLAVSGLHIGIAFLLINVLLLPLVLLRYGNVIRSVVAVALIWCYVWLCGMSPSAVRAAIMFSLLQVSLSSTREYVSINILAGTAFVMLAFDSHQLFDISFQLSFIAVTGIILWAIPLYRLCATRFKAINILLGVLLVGIASTVATMPLVAKSFATISLVGVAINPIVITLANIIVFTGILALVLPSVAVIAEVAAEWQNSVVEWAASLPCGHFDLSIPSWAMWCIYLLFAGVTITLLLLPKRKKEPKIEG